MEFHILGSKYFRSEQDNHSNSDLSYCVNMNLWRSIYLYAFKRFEMT